MQTVRRCIQRVAKEQSRPAREPELQHSILGDLGFRSLDVALLSAYLETEFKFDPFEEGLAVITEIRTVSDIVNLYERGLQEGM